jgi:hypothetical protein
MAANYGVELNAEWSPFGRHMNFGTAFTRGQFVATTLTPFKYAAMIDDSYKRQVIYSASLNTSIALSQEETCQKCDDCENRMGSYGCTKLWARKGGVYCCQLD